jgi:hypothetical protein
VQGATSCCNDRAQAFDGAQPLERASLVFEKNSRHFDFGTGLAPFAVFRLPANAKLLEAEAELQLLGWAYGGDGAARYVDVSLRFYGAGEEELPAKVIESSQAFTGMGARSLFSYVEVPQGAAFVVVTTDPASNGKLEVGVIRNLPSTPVTSQSRNFFSWGGIMPTGYKLASYGPLRVRTVSDR